MTRFRKTLTAGLAALTLGASLAATATPADAFGRHGWRGGGVYGGGWRHRGWRGPGPLVAGAIGGLALGALAAGAYNSYGCVADQPVYDSWGNFIGYQRVRVACY
ncbi:MAG: hypothetical protein H6872_08570 [Methylobacteriaceae bacterium]|nr:hypothetical protein [Methylobacteriaceae bacterium]